LDEATDYYIDTSQTDKLCDVACVGRAVDAQISEKILEDFLEKISNVWSPVEVDRATVCSITVLLICSVVTRRETS
jgi:hypothetical protein